MLDSLESIDYQDSGKGGKLMSRYLTLDEEMARSKVLKGDIASLLEIHRNSVANKLNGLGDFTVTEAIKIRDTYFPKWTIEELFKRSNQ